MENSGLKVIAVCLEKYDNSKDELLQSFIDKGYELISFVGVDCDIYENVLDELLIGGGSNSSFIVTTSHSKEPIEDVINMVNHMSPDGGIVKVVTV